MRYARGSRSRRRKDTRNAIRANVVEGGNIEHRLSGSSAKWISQLAKWISSRRWALLREEQSAKTVSVRLVSGPEEEDPLRRER